MIGTSVDHRDICMLAIEALPHPFYVINADDFTIALANSASGFGPLNSTSTCHALTHHSATPCSGEDHPCPLMEVKRTRKPVVIEHVHFDDEDREHVVEIHACPVFDDAGDVVQMIEYTLDITEKKQLERARERLLLELQGALENVKILSGLLPICAWCKRIRDDSGYWKEIEAYLRAHSEVEFTHSICPSCRERLYPPSEPASQR
jgi:hypothetical protein